MEKGEGNLLCRLTIVCMTRALRVVHARSQLIYIHKPWPIEEVYARRRLRNVQATADAGSPPSPLDVHCVQSKDYTGRKRPTHAD